MCRKWCDYDYYKLSDKVVLDGLRDLGYFLDIHYNSKLYVHIDEYDSVITELMFDVEDELKKKNYRTNCKPNFRAVERKQLCRKRDSNWYNPYGW